MIKSILFELLIRPKNNKRKKCLIKNLKCVRDRHKKYKIKRDKYFDTNINTSSL